MEDKKFAQEKMQEATKRYLDVMVKCFALADNGMVGIEAVIFNKDDGKYYQIKLREVKEGEF